MESPPVRLHLLALVIVIPLVLTAPVQGWGFDVHYRINQAAAILLQDSLDGFLAAYRDTLAHYAPAPDRWRSHDSLEGYRHYIDIDLYAEYPFTGMPLTYSGLVQQYGPAQVPQQGLAPYYITQLCDSIAALMRAGRWTATLIPLAALGHYVADLHMPLHVVENYNGQLTGNTGVHFWWETVMVDRFITDIQGDSGVRAWPDVLPAVFEIVRESYLVHRQVLRADSLARQSLGAEEQVLLAGYAPLPDSLSYVADLYRESGALARERLRLAVNRVAAGWYTCWVRAGKPQPQIP